MDGKEYRKKPLSMILFLVNRPENSWAGMRAREFAQEIGKSFETRIFYREKGKLWEMVRFTIGVLRCKPRFLYVLDLGYATGGAALLAKVVWGARIVLDVGDIGYKLSESLGDRTRIEMLFMKVTEELAWKAAELMIVRGRGFKYHLNRMGYRNVVVVPDCVDTNVVKEVTVSSLREELGLDDAFTIGTLGTSIWSEKLKACSGWEIIETIRILRRLPIRGVIIGYGSGIPVLKERARSYGILDRVLFIEGVSYENVPKYLCLMDICMSTQSNDIVGRIRTTGKLPLYLACNRYILATRVGEARYVLPEEMLVDYRGTIDLDYPERLSRRISELYENPQLLTKRKKGKEIAKRYFDTKILARSVASLIDKRAEKEIQSGSQVRQLA